MTMRRRAVVRRVVATVMMMTPLFLVWVPTASADCVGYSTNGERIEAARSYAALVAFGTATDVQSSPAPVAGGVPVDVYSFSIDRALRGTAAGETVDIAAPQASSVSRSFTVGQKYFLAPSDSSHNQWPGIDLPALAPLADTACSPTVSIDDVTGTFTDVVIAGIPSEVASAATASAGPDSETIDNSTEVSSQQGWWWAAAAGLALLVAGVVVSRGFARRTRIDSQQRIR